MSDVLQIGTDQGREEKPSTTGTISFNHIVDLVQIEILNEQLPIQVKFH